MREASTGQEEHSNHDGEGQMHRNVIDVCHQHFGTYKDQHHG